MSKLLPAGRVPVAVRKDFGALSTSTSTRELRMLLEARLLETVAHVNIQPLSSAQKRLWFLDQIEPNTPLYNLPSVVRLKGNLDLAALEQSLKAIVARHEILRTRFVESDGEPGQILDEEASLEVQRHNLTSLSGQEKEGEAERLIQQEVRRPFNLSRDRLFRATLLHLAPQEHILILNMHHIISDEWSFQVFYSELTAFYTGFVRGEKIVLPPLEIQYSDYAAWQSEWLKSDAFQQQLAFWKKQLGENPPAVELPTDRPARPRPSRKGRTVARPLNQNLSERLRELARQEGLTLFMLLLAGFKALLYRYTHQEEIVIGSPIAGRKQVETEGLIGLFVNLLALRTRVSGDLTFRNLLARIRELTLGAYSHQDLPFDKLVEELQPDRSIHETPLVKLMFLVQNSDGQVQLPGLQLEFLDSDSGTAKFDLLLGVHASSEGMVCVAQYDTDLFDAETIERFLDHYEHLLLGAVRAPNTKLSDLPLLSKAERRQLLDEWNNTQTNYPRDRCIHQLFEQQVAKTPERIAVNFGGRALTYFELNTLANQLARHLKTRDVRPGRLVVIIAERSIENIVGLLAILKTGAAYASIDRAIPKQRLADIIEELRPPVLLTQHRLFEFLEQCLGGQNCTIKPTLICLDSDSPTFLTENPGNLSCGIESNEPAYVCFTSGSTGKPRGVVVPHRAVVRLVQDTDYADFTPEEVFLQAAPISFDASTFEIWGALLNGARLVMLPMSVPSLSDLEETILRQGVTTAWFTSGLFNQIVDERPEILKPLRQILTGGDVLSPAHVRKALYHLGPSSRLINGYGPTENTTFTTCYELPRNFDGVRSIPIGRPIANTTCYILAENLAPVPIGVPGELYAGGEGLALGYLNAPQLTAEKFVPSPFESGGRLYKTGDRARYLSDGNIEFLGRSDFQVKVRGFRIELGEIESALLQHPAVRQAVVVARTGPNKDLIAYVVLQDGGTPASDELRGFLEQRLPEYMVPSFFVTLERLPLSANGKVDRKALPEPGPVSTVVSGSSEPKDDIERQLQQLWQSVLSVARVGPHDKFFALGGHSLLAVRLIAQVEKQFGRRLSVADLFQNPSISQLAVVLRGNSPQGASSAIVEIQPCGSKPPLFLIHGAGGGMFWGYNNLAHHLGPDQPVFGFKSRGLDGEDELDTIEELAEVYLADLRDFQPQGPYFLGGYCFGGVVAYEMASRLRRRNEEVAFLGLINSTAPNSSYSLFHRTPADLFKFIWNILLRSFYSIQAGKFQDLMRWNTRFLAKRFHRMLPRPATSTDRRLHKSALRTSGSAIDVPNGDVDEFVDLSQYSEDQRRVWQSHFRALIAYRPPQFPIHVTLFRSPVHLLRSSFDSRYGWADVALAGVTVKTIPGAHEAIMEEPLVAKLAFEMARSLSDARRGVV